MSLNKKYLYFGASLFSAILLIPLDTQIAKAETTTTNNTDKTISSNSSTVPTPQQTTDPISDPNNAKQMPTTTQPAPTNTMTTPDNNPAPLSTPKVPISQSSTSAAQIKPIPQVTQVISSADSSQQTTSSTGTINNIPDNTIINFTDPLLGAVVKKQLNMKPNDNLTAGSLKSFTGNIFNANEQMYLTGQTQTSLSDQQVTPIESLNGMQYLQLLPTKTNVMFQAKLASDPKSDPSLTPLNNLKFSALDIVGNFSNPNAKQIDTSQISKLNVLNSSEVSLNGDQSVSYGSGITNQQLKEISPWLINYVKNVVNNTANKNTIQLSNSSITDFSSLKGLENGNKVNIIADTPVHIDQTPIYAINNQPIAFTAKPVLGIDGDDLANGYYFSNTVSQQYLTEDNLTNLGNDKYILEHPAPNAQVLAYGYLGFGYSSNPNNYVNKNYGNATLQYYILNGQPLIWQDHPNITVNYLNSDNKPLSVNEKAPQLINGNNIGDPYDLTNISQIKGYKLITPELLKGNYTQDPQIINLIYTENPISNHSSSTNTSTQYIPVYDDNGNPINNTYVNVENEIIRASIRKNNQTLYQITTGQWVLANDFYAQKQVTKDFRTFDKNTKLIDSQGNILSTTIAPNSEWKVLKIIEINGKKYYEVAPNEFILFSDAIEFIPLDDIGHVHLNDLNKLYNSKGKLLNSELMSGSEWLTDGFAIINGQKMYRVANDEWVNASELYLYQPTKTVFHTTKITKLFDHNGRLLNNYLKSQTNWKVDQIVKIGASTYYRVATDEFILI